MDKNNEKQFYKNDEKSDTTESIHLKNGKEITAKEYTKERKSLLILLFVIVIVIVCISFQESFTKIISIQFILQVFRNIMTAIFLGIFLNYLLKNFDEYTDIFGNSKYKQYKEEQTVETIQQAIELYEKQNDITKISNRRFRQCNTINNKKKFRR